MTTQLTKKAKVSRRHARVRAKVSGTATRPRLAVYRSNTQIIAQLIDDETRVTLAAAASAKEKGATPRERAEAAATNIAAQAQKKGITSIVFDRGGFQYTGTIAAFAEAVRKGGLTF
jgi:large subunit ribosomal protein L18